MYIGTWRAPFRHTFFISNNMEEPRKDNFAAGSSTESEAIEYAIADVITGRPHEFAVGSERLRLYPVTLAKLYLLKPYIRELGINENRNPYMEALRIAVQHKDVCVALLAIYTSPNGYSSLFDTRARASRREVLAKADKESLATMLVTVLKADKTEQIIRHLGIDKDQGRLREVMKVKLKHSKNSLSFGGVSIFGSFIGQLKEMGYSDDEILYERPYSFLRLMLADKTCSVYLSDEELLEVPDTSGGAMLNGDDPASVAKLKNMLAGKGVKFN